METTLRTAINLFGNLRSLNGQDSVVETEGQKKIITQPFQFDAKTVWVIAKNMNVLKRHVEVFETARSTLLQNIGDIESDGAKRKQFIAGVNEMLDENVKLEGVTKIKLSGLNLEKNAIQPGLLADLAELIEE